MKVVLIAVATAMTTVAGAVEFVDADLAKDAVRFGTDANGLTGVQLRMLCDRNGKRVVLDENGWLRTYDGGFKLLVR